VATVSERVDPIPAEARSFQGRRAGLVTRAVSAAIDAGVVALLMVCGYAVICVVVFLIHPRTFELPAAPWWLAMTVGYAGLTLYLGASWHGGGRTYGCHVMGLRVTDDGGRILPLWAAYVRAVFYVALPLGIVWVAFSRANQSIQDLVLRTSVVYDWDVRPMPRIGQEASGV
jgi:uncharacterized RDD family membrane protein YckC